MGSFGPAFVQALAGNLSGQAPSPVGMVPPENGMTEAVMGFPSVSRTASGFIDPGPVPDAPPGFGGGPNPDGSISLQGAPSAGGMTPDVEAVIKGFKPKKISFWGALGDQLMKHWGNEPVFSKRIESKNMRRAMEGFTQDPVEAIRRIAQIPGHEEDAWKLLNTLKDNERADSILERQNRALDLQNERIMYDRVAGMMGVAQPDSWQKMRETAIKVGQARGVDVSHLIPEQYDPDSIEYIRYGTVKPKDQMTIEERSRHNTVTEGQGQARIDETVRNNNIRDENADTAEAGRNTRYNTPKPKAAPAPSAQSVLPDGSRIVYGGGDKRTAKTAIMIRPDGTKRYLNKLPSGKWKVVAPPTK